MSLKGVNVHEPQYREAKPSQGAPSATVTELFRLNNRTIIGMVFSIPTQFNLPLLKRSLSRVNPITCPNFI
jgi:hypothetical protein